MKSSILMTYKPSLGFVKEIVQKNPAGGIQRSNLPPARANLGPDLKPAVD
jgi:hypothetical protein